jgi:hypothetical protein
MRLTVKTESQIKKIIKALNGYQLAHEVLGNQIDTDNCTILVRKGNIQVNEEPVDNIEDMLIKVLDVERP